MDDDTWKMVLDTSDDFFDRGDTTLVDELALAGITPMIATEPSRWGTIMRRQGFRLGRSQLVDVFAAGADHECELGVVLPYPPSDATPTRQFCDRLEVDGLVTSENLSTVLLATESTLFTASIDNFIVTELDTIDPESGWRAIRGFVPARKVVTLGPGSWSDLRHRSAIALGWELVGVADRAIETVITYATGREQFGSPLTAKQTVRHRIVDATIRRQAAIDALLVADDLDTVDDLSWMTAKALAGEAAAEAVSVAQQICGAMGFTYEFGLHHSVRRSVMLDSVLGEHHTLTERIGARLRARGSTPCQLSAPPAIDI